MSELVLSVPQELRRGKNNYKELESVAEGVGLLDLICRNYAIPDLGQKKILDIGCGTKLVQAILDRELPIGQYTGVDVFPELIEFLKEEVSDEATSRTHTLEDRKMTEESFT